MNREFENEIWESALKNAVLENSLEESEAFPSPTELKKISLPPQYEKNMQKFIQRYQRKKKAKTFGKYCRKAASFFLILVGASFIFLLLDTSVRASCKNVITRIYEQFIRMDYESEQEITENSKLDIGYVPDSYSLVESESDEYMITFVYQDTHENQIEIVCYLKNGSFQYDNERYSVSKTKVLEYTGTFFQANNPTSRNYLVWDTEYGFLELSAKLEREEMLKIAENIKFL